MSLIFDRRVELGDGPGVHALIAGVSRYPHLLGGEGPVARQTFGLHQIQAAAPAATRISSWLVSHSEYLPVPLATVRLLLSPLDSSYQRRVKGSNEGIWLPFIGHGKQGLSD